MGSIGNVISTIGKAAGASLGAKPGATAKPASSPDSSSDTSKASYSLAHQAGKAIKSAFSSKSKDPDNLGEQGE